MQIGDLREMPTTERFIPVIRPWMDQREVEAAGRVILSGWVTQGPEVAAFEKDFAAYVGAQHACAVSSCTTALHLALLAAGVREKSEVITVSHSYIATANSVRYCGATPVFIDISPDTFNMNPDLIEKAITPQTTAILCVHQIGMPCDMKSIMEIARRHSLPVVEDAACAIGSELLFGENWEKIGKPHGDISCFSLHPRKLLTTGDGGMLTTSNPEWDKYFRLMRHHGMDVSAAARHEAKDIIFESYPLVAYNYRMTDIQAAIGRVQLSRLPEIVQRRRLLAAPYHERLSQIPGLKVPFEPEWARSNWQSYCVRLPKKSNQRRVMQLMLDCGIATRRAVMCSHREKAYEDVPTPWPLVESEKAQDRCIILPLYHQMTEDDQDFVISKLHEACS
jgi:perosamine synthetase